MIISTFDYVTSQLKSKNSVDVIYLDFEKAFDKVDKLLLIDKLTNMNIPTFQVILFYGLIVVFFSNRTQVVWVRDSVSGPVGVPSGIPHGFVLGSILFTVYFNDLFKVPLHSKILSFAGDTILLNLSRDFYRT